MDKSPKKTPKAKKKAEEVKPQPANAADDQTDKNESGQTGNTKIKKGQPRSLR